MRVIKYILLLIALPVQAHDLWDVRDGNDWLITNGSICIITTYANTPVHSNVVPTRLSVSIANYNWGALTAKQKLACENLMKATITTTLKAVPSSNGTRRTRDITAITYTSTRIPDTSLCEGAIIKKYQKNKNWHKVVGQNLTTLCGQY